MSVCSVVEVTQLYDVIALMPGTSGNSYTQLRSALGYHKDASDTDINGAYQFLMERIKKLDAEAGSSILLSIANGLFSQMNSRISNDYIGWVCLTLVT